MINVNFSKNLISSEEIERKILNFLSARCSDCEYNLTLKPMPEIYTREWELDFDQMTAKGGLLLPVRDPSNQTLKWISGQIRISRLTPVVTRMISQGERLSSTDLQLTMTDITFAKDNSLRIEDIEGQIAARTLAVGTVVWASDIRKEPATKKGQMVKGLMGNESFEISVNMEAQENGFIGDIVKVKNLENNKYFSGQVVEKGVVKLQ
jgi:flagella basal body P-ring formation protein FlgA